MQAEYILKKANELVNKCGERDPFYAADCSGAIVKYKDLGTLKGAYFGNMKTPAIVINTDLDERMQRLICAHELGHHILHTGQFLSCKNCDFQNAAIMEREANIFASAFLIDSQKLISLLSSGNTISQAAAIFETDPRIIMFLLNAFELADAPESTFLK